MAAMAPEEFKEFIDNQSVAEGPIYDITLIEATTEETVLEYEGERVVFTDYRNRISKRIMARSM